MDLNNIKIVIMTIHLQKLLPTIDECAETQGPMGPRAHGPMGPRAHVPKGPWAPRAHNNEIVEVPCLVALHVEVAGFLGNE